MRVPRHVLVATIIPLATLALYFCGAAMTPPGKSYTWMHALNTGDPHAYLSWVAQARDGDLLFRVLFTEEPCAARLFHPLFLAMGLVARATNLPLMAVFHGSRVLLGAVLLLLLARFFERRAASHGAAFFALLYAALGSGLGWIFVRPAATAMNLPVDLWMPEAILFLTILESPLNLAALVAAVALIERICPAGTPDPNAVVATRALGLRRYIAPLLLTLFLGLTHPFEIISVAAIAATTALLAGIRRGVARARVDALRASAVAFVAGAGLAALAIQVALRGEPVFAHWLATARSPSPAPLLYVLAFAPQIALALLAVPRRWARGGAGGHGPLRGVGGPGGMVKAPRGPPRRVGAGGESTR